MKVFGFFLAAAGILMALSFGWVSLRRVEQRCPPGYSLALADPLATQSRKTIGLECVSDRPSQHVEQKIGILGVDDK